MGKLVARLLGKTELAVAEDGKVTLTDADRDLIRANYGEPFLTKLERMSFADSQTTDSTHELFDAAVAFHVEQAKAPLMQQVASLQNTINALADEPELTPSATTVGECTVTRFQGCCTEKGRFWRKARDRRSLLP